MSARGRGRNGAGAIPRVVAIGGGTGMPAVLRGLREALGSRAADHLAAIVTMTDDGGSSGRLRAERALPPPGDVRNCLLALARDNGVLAELFGHRYGTGRELCGHSLGNLILAALEERTGSFLAAIELAGRVLRAAGRIFPSTLEDVTLEAVFEDGTTVTGESRIDAAPGRIRRLGLRPAAAGAGPGVQDAIERADLVVLGPGSLYTSLLPSLLVPGVADALQRTRALVVLVANLMGERPGACTLRDHLRAVETHAGAPVVDAVLAHGGGHDPGALERYRAEGMRPLDISGPCPVPVFRSCLVAPGPALRHDPRATGRALLRIWRVVRPRTEASAGPAPPRRGDLSKVEAGNRYEGSGDGGFPEGAKAAVAGAGDRSLRPPARDGRGVVPSPRIHE